MDRGDDVIELGQDFVVEIERAVAENVALDAGEEPEVFEFAIELSDRRDLRAQPRGIESARLDRAAAVIGDAEILQAELLRRRGHFLERIVAVARGGVAMESAAQIFRFDQARQRSRGGGLELAAVLAQLRRDVIEIERAIQVRLLANCRDFGRDLLSFFASAIGRRWREPIFVQASSRVAARGFARRCCALCCR